MLDRKSEQEVNNTFLIKLEKSSKKPSLFLHEVGEEDSGVSQTILIE
jgi:hypothetical protein